MAEGGQDLSDAVPNVTVEYYGVVSENNGEDGDKFHYKAEAGGPIHIQIALARMLVGNYRERLKDEPELTVDSYLGNTEMMFDMLMAEKGQEE